jgi:predicted transposase/invertase (TIGR01784 family)
MKNTIQSGHDKFFRQSMSDPRVAHDFFEAHLPDKIKALADLNTLKLSKESYIDQALKESIVDALFSVNFSHHKGYFYVLVEHQSTVDQQMPFRLLKYLVRVMEHHLKENQTKELPLIYPLVFYTGPTAYSASLDLFDLFPEPTLARDIFLQPFQLVDVNQIPDEVLQTRIWDGLMALCLKYVYQHDILPILNKYLLSLFKELAKQEGEDYIEQVLVYLIRSAKISDKKLFCAILEENLPPAIGEKVMTLAEQLKQEGHKEGLQAGIILGRQEGHQEGRLEGRQEGERLVLQRLLQHKFGSIPEKYLKFIRQADADTLLELSERVLDTKNLDDLFKK